MNTLVRAKGNDLNLGRHNAHHHHCSARGLCCWRSVWIVAVVHDLRRTQARLELDEVHEALGVIGAGRSAGRIGAVGSVGAEQSLGAKLDTLDALADALIVLSKFLVDLHLWTCKVAGYTSAPSMLGYQNSSVGNRDITNPRTRKNVQVNNRKLKNILIRFKTNCT